MTSASSSSLCRSLLVTLLAIVPVGCELSTGPMPNRPESGVDVLVSLDDRAVPTTGPCGIGELSGSILLGTGRNAAYTSRVTLGNERTYTGSGTYRMSGGDVVLTLHGGWSNHETLHTNELRLQVDGNALIETGVGAACDAQSTRRFVLQRP
jgi:hypothetical protein